MQPSLPCLTFEVRAAAIARQIFHFLLAFIYRCTRREGDAIRLVQRFQVYLVEADAQPYGHDGTQQFAVLQRIERG